MKHMQLDAQRTALVAVHLQGDVVTHEGATIAYTRIVFSAGHPELIANNALFGVVEPAKCCLDGAPGLVASEVTDAATAIAALGSEVPA
jgi:hypothetical protein